MSYTFQALVRRADYAEYVTGGNAVLSRCNRATEAGTDAMNPATLQQAPDNRRLRISLGLRLNQRKIGNIPQTKVRLTVFVEEIHRVFRLPLDRKSTRLNSSHGSISYAVFCLKK